MRERTVVPHPSLAITVERCGPEDLEPMLDRLETLLHEDYFFRRKHFAAILARPQAAVYAIRVDDDFSAIAIVYDGSILQNLYVHPEHRRLGVGQAVLKHLNPSVIRAKGNMSQGNPVPFYEAQGYHAVAPAPGKPHILLMEKNTPATPTPASPPTALPAPSPAPISEAKRAHLDAIRAKSIARRKQKKAEDDYRRMIAAGIDPSLAHVAAYGETHTPVVGHVSE